MWKNEITRHNFLTNHICKSWCLDREYHLEMKRCSIFYLLWMHKATFSSFLFHPYKVEKEKPFNFRDSICDRTPRLAYVGGQKVVLHNFIFPPFLHLGVKNTAFQWKYPEYKL